MAKNKIWLIIIFAVIVYLIMGMYADFDSLLEALKDFNPAILLVLFLLTFVNYSIRFIKWDFFLKRAGVHLNLKDNLFVFFSGLSMIITPGKIGEIWKGWLIKDINGEKLSKTIPVVIVERITDVTGLIILAIFGVLYYKEGIYLIIILLLVLVGFFVMIRSKRISSKLISILERRAGKHAENIKTMHETFTKTMEPKGLIGMSFLSAFAWFFECLGFYLVVHGFGESISITQGTFIFSFASLAGAVSMIPGGLGVAEATISGLLQLYGIPAATSIGIAIIVRFGTLWFGAILGFSVYLLFKKKIMKGTKKL
ncbi:MAG: flippase-like domain-containing protein [Methanomassiliicoccales archaeon]|nr:MAG: flippase-like domain-containing protein [Methanomassiliicoccales archaeon]